MKLLFRVNASQREGTGHLYECLWAARELQAESVFCVNPDPVAGRLAREFGFSAHVLPLGKAEMGRLNKIIAAERPDVVIVDLVDLDQAYLRRLVLRGARLLVMNALLHPVSADAQVATVFLPHLKNKQYFGGRYVLMKPLLRRLPPRPKGRMVKNVVVLFGGGDAGGFTLKALRVLRAVPGNFHVQVIAGAANKNFKAIQKALQKFPKAFTLYRHITNERKLAVLLRMADLAFASGGYTLAELLHFGVPTIALAQNDIELNHVFPLFPKGAFVNLGPGSRVSEARLIQAIKELAQSYSRRRAMSARARRAVDGAGIARFEKIITQLVRPQVVVLGARGNLGRVLVPRLRKHFAVRTPAVDITNPAALRKAIRPGDTILNLVGASTDQKHPKEQYRTNVLAQKILLDACREANIKRIIFPSSLNVYKFLGRRPSRESDPVAAADDYTRTKLRAEKIYKKYARYFQVIILRLGSVYGPGLGKGILPQFAKTIKEERTIIIPKPMVFRDMLYIGDLASLMKRAVSCDAKGFVLLNGASGRKVSFKKLAELAQRAVDRAVKIRYNNDRPISTWGDPGLARKILNFQARTSISEGVRRTLRALIK